MVLFSEVVAASAALTATRSRKAKTQALAALLVATSNPDELGVVVGFLTGEPRQGRFGIGWSTLAALEAPAAAIPELTVRAVDEALSDIASTTGAGSAARRRSMLSSLFARASRDEQHFLVALLTGELRQGALEGVMLDAVATAFGVPAEAVRRAFMLSGRLPATSVAAMVGGSAALDAFRLELGRPVRPMLASAADSLDAALAELGETSVEYKLDGARIQVHRDGEEVRVWTRTLREITAGVPELVDLVRGLPCSSVVLDGETLALTDDGRPRSFQETMSRFGADSPRDLLLRPFFFDCLHRDGTDLLDTPLADRLAALEAVAGPYRIPSVQDAASAPGLLDASLAAGHEGVMVKSLNAPYAAGRRGRAWQKVKPVHTLDLVVLAAEWGHGRRRGWLSNLHLGARDTGGGPPVMVGKTFKGLTDQLLTWQTSALQEIALQEITQRTEEYVVHVRPELVVENNWVITGILVYLPMLSRPVCLPVLGRLVVKDTTSASRLWLARQMIQALATAFPDRRIHVVTDGAYAGRELRELPDRVSWTTRPRKDAALYDLAPPRTGKRGRPRLTGPRLGSLATLAATATFTPATVSRYQNTTTVDVATITCLWYTVFDTTPVRVILVREPGTHHGYDLALITTDTTTKAPTVIERYATRWSIEVAIQDAKQLFGTGQARNRLPTAVRRTVPFALITQTLTTLWYTTTGYHPDDITERRDQAPWYPAKPQPSTADMITKLRKVLRATQFPPAHPHPPTPAEIHTLRLAWATDTA